MSQRSIIEINHDFSHVIRDRSNTFLTALDRALRSGSDESWEPLKPFGITRIVQIHHSTPCKVVTGAAGDETEYFV